MNVAAALNASGRLIIGDDPGLGKTFQTFGYIKISKPKRTLIVAPTSVVYKWQEELYETLRKISFVVDRAGLELADAYELASRAGQRVLIVTWDLLSYYSDDLRRAGWDLLVLDEAHRMKNLSALRTKAARQIGREVPHILFLTGSPLINRQVEVWPILNLIDPNEWPSYMNFKRTYQDYSGQAATWKVRSKVDLDRKMAQARADQQARLAERIKPYMVRRLKTTQTPHVKVRLPLPEDFVRDYNHARRDLVGYLQTKGLPSRAAEKAQALVKVGVLRRILGRAKVAPTVDLARDLLDSDETRKVLIYAIHHDVVEAIWEQLAEYGPLTITGTTTAQMRHNNVGAFQTMAAHRVMIVSEAGEEGINLFAANYLIFAERPWTPKGEDQAIGRIDRIGQTRNTTAYYPLVRGTIDERIDRLIERKRETIRNVVGQQVPDVLLREILELELESADA